ncbi:MAG: Peptidase S1 and S6 chymotrypsin/Hap [candidate division WWE3 bacterium GW2011_GWC2_44_9]|uniref:Peptidase S1 and S6 chymotrypsin/Hap n=1 Tax=candidate division WWE3 bacterium GW2011_GWC2_44_9 TaxID=1619125 RepID=A0A0G1NHY3_UNCKA|nr:MAG: Peptidase S1 and S6 chymotrypsin/Hap [candidate division WWE3 bacterium GW2011_GWC2_44_9]
MIMHEKLKNYKSLLYLMFFILILVFLRLSFAPQQSFLPSDIKGKIEAWFAQRGVSLFKAKPLYSRVETKEVVQEESQVVDVVEKVSPAVVSIVIKTVDFSVFSGPSLAESGIGTGFIVDKNGLIVTNSHVVDNDAGDYSVILKDGTTYPVEKIHLDTQNDFAILEISARDLPTVDFGDSDALKVGQKAIAIGNALGQFQNTVTVGVVSGLGRSITAFGPFGDEKTYSSVIQTDAAINPGNSGGPLLNISGQVIGINVATSSRAENVSFAIPVNDLKPVLESFIENGRIVKPYLGVSYVMISKEIAELRNFPEGAYVTGIVKDSPAEKVGLKRGDIITKFGDSALGTGFTLSQAVLKGKVGGEEMLTIDRDKSILLIKVTVEEMPANL